MSDKVMFLSKFLAYKTYVKGKAVVFEKGIYWTDDTEIVEGLRKNSDFGITLFEQVQNNTIENPAEVASAKAASENEIDAALKDGVEEGAEMVVKVEKLGNKGKHKGKR